MGTQIRIISVNPSYKPLGELFADPELCVYKCPRDVKRSDGRTAAAVWRCTRRVLGDYPASAAMNTALVAMRCGAALLLLAAFGDECGALAICMAAMLACGALCRPVSGATAAVCLAAAVNPAGIAAATLCAALVPLGAGCISADRLGLHILARRRARNVAEKAHLDYRMYRKL